MKFFIIISFVALAYGLPKPQSDEDDTRIVSGVQAKQMIPYLVSIRKLGGAKCGGSILDETTILTAAHCLEDKIDPDVMSIGVGSMELHEQTQYLVSSYIMHDQYNQTVPTNYDVALIKLSKPLKLIPGLVEKVKLPTSCPGLPYGEYCTAAGWGREYPDIVGPVNDLNQIKLKIIHDNDPGCKPYKDNKELSDIMFCAGSPDATGDTCEGDSGGPLTCVNADNNDAIEQVGIVSWGEGCSVKGFAGVYTYVCKVKSWIEKNRGSGKNEDSLIEQPDSSISQNSPSLLSQQITPITALRQNPSELSSFSWWPHRSVGGFFW